MVDDMGFSDLGCYGGEIETPNINSLAKGGVKFSNFYNSGRCCPTRASLLTGLHPHQTGIGWMTQPPGNERGKDEPPAYQGYLNRECVTLAEALSPADYTPLMAGKWHLGFHDQDRWPLQRGFQKFYGSITGATRFFYPVAPRSINRGNTPLKDPKSTTDRKFYTTDAFTDNGIRHIAEQREEAPENPFFLYLAYTAPHWPIQAHESDIDKYRDRYHGGWDKLRKERYQRQLDLGVINASCKLSPRDEKVPAWDTLEEKPREDLALRMATYAAMIDRVDQNIGNLLNFLKEEELYKDTLILFLSDNGACQEFGIIPEGDFADIEKRNQSHNISYGQGWANAGSTPFRLYKHFVHEGGAATPFIAHWPAGIQAQDDWYREPAQIIDVMPTLLDLAGAQYPEKAHGNDLPPLPGISLRPAFQGKPLKRNAPLYGEHENNAFLRDGDWKLVGRNVARKNGIAESQWELYNLAEDRSELNNLAEEEPEKLADYTAQWKEWAMATKVYPKKKP
jgi:arylsulfatase